MTQGPKMEKLQRRLEQKIKEYLPLCGNCAQSAFLSLQEVFDLENGGILKALTPFPGIALRGETCGAVIGCLMALGLVYGRGKESLGDWSAYLKSLPPACRFCRRFEEAYGSMMCGDIIEAQFGKRYNLANPAEAMEWMNCGAVEKCGAVIQTGVFLAADIISRRRELGT